MMEIASNPAAYARYLDMQGENPMYSAGNIALVMVQNPDATQIATADRWKAMGRTVLEVEKNNGVQIFSRSTFGKGYTLANAYDISQTFGREIKRQVLKPDSPEMEKALTALLNFSVVPVVIDNEIGIPAWYDSRNMELAIQPDFPDAESFAAIAAEVAHSRFHAKGATPGYSHEESDLDAHSVSYILCKRFGIERSIPELSNLQELYEGWDAQDIRQALTSIQDMSKQIGGSIERSIAPQQHSRGNMRRPSR